LKKSLAWMQVQKISLGFLIPMLSRLLRNIEFRRFQNAEQLYVCLHQYQHQVTFLDKTGKSLF